MTAKDWLRSLVSVAVGGAANTLASLVVAPDQFNFHHPAKLLEMAGAGALIAIVHFLQKNPVWGEDGK